MRKDYQVGDWVLVRFPQDESGKSRKLARPQRGPYRFLECTDPHVTVSKVYFEQDGYTSLMSPPVPLDFLLAIFGMEPDVAAQDTLLSGYRS